MNKQRIRLIAVTAIGAIVCLSLPGGMAHAGSGKAVAAKQCKRHHHKKKCKKRPATTAAPQTAAAPPSTSSAGGPAATSPPAPHTLSVATDGSGFGVVESSPAGIRCPSPSCSATFDPGTTVTLTATPEAGNAFDHWSGACSGSGPCRVTMDADQSVTATFSADVRTLTVQVTSKLTAAADGGAVTSDDYSINCRESTGTCSALYPYGASVILKAEAAAGWAFWGWGGGACSGFATTCEVTMNADRAVTADFIDS